MDSKFRFSAPVSGVEVRRYGLEILSFATSQVQRYGLKMLLFCACYFRIFENFSPLRTSAPRLVVHRYGGAEVRTEINVVALVMGACGSWCKDSGIKTTRTPRPGLCSSLSVFALLCLTWITGLLYFIEGKSVQLQLIKKCLINISNLTSLIYILSNQVFKPLLNYKGTGL
ncbi:hypothetical protein E2C01_096629 [Portunus trituberculatus]|uniref:Uncharacterized protein n=1 Tax=Portunus trituberculatus TaxID=210409 RepID=A0A5B7K2I5_PORTR|nr:hypothetical protein [Portunus trituberculatus]